MYHILYYVIYYTPYYTIPYTAILYSTVAILWPCQLQTLPRPPRVHVGMGNVTRNNNLCLQLLHSC